MLLSAISMSGSRDTMRLKNSQMPNLADARRAFQDEIGDVLGKKGARNVRGHVFDHLRRNLGDIVVGRARETVLVADAIVHDGRGSRESRCHAGFYQRARFSGSFYGDVPAYVFGVHMKPPFTRRFTHAPRFPCFAIKRTRPLRNAASFLTHA